MEIQLFSNWECIATVNNISINKGFKEDHKNFTFQFLYIQNVFGKKPGNLDINWIQNDTSELMKDLSVLDLSESFP